MTGQATTDPTELAQSPARWEVLRVWHLEAMECVIESSMPATFMRTSYVSVPASWKSLSARELATRIGDSYRAFEVRGAASRYFPQEEFARMGSEGADDIARMNKAWNDDAHPKGGSFAGAMGPTAGQAAQQHVEKEERTK